MNCVIIGAGKYGEVYLTYLKEAGLEVVGFLDDDETLWGRSIQGIPVLGGSNHLKTLHSKLNVSAVYCPIGNNPIRVNFLKEARRLGYLTPSFIHKDVHMGPEVQVSENGVYILDQTTIMPHVLIEDDVMISVGANIIHHTTLKQGVFVSNGVNLGASLIAEECAYIGMGSTIVTGVKRLGKDSLIGAGAVVLKDVPDGAVVAGVPAKILRYKEGYGCKMSF